jgi:hypothetical protein
MRSLTEALVAAGFLAVAVDHHGNNFIDGYCPEGFVPWWERARDFSFVLDELRGRAEIGVDVGAPAPPHRLIDRRVSGLGPPGAWGCTLPLKRASRAQLR